MASILSTGIEVRVYRSNPVSAGRLPVGRFKKGDVALVVNYFGLVSSVQNLVEARGEVELIEDHSHDPASEWAHASKADWCVASLRMTIPMPDGGVLWSPRRHTLPESPPLTWEHYLASKQKQSGLMLQGNHFENGLESKWSDLDHSNSAERIIADGQISGASPWVRGFLKGAPVDRWRAIRRTNYITLARALAGIPWITLLRTEPAEGMSPLAVMMVFRSEAQTRLVQRQLNDAMISAKVFWPLSFEHVEGVDREDIFLSQRILAIDCDSRYDEADMMRISEIVANAGELSPGND